MRAGVTARSARMDVLDRAWEDVRRNRSEQRPLSIPALRHTCKNRNRAATGRRSKKISRQRCREKDAPHRLACLHCSRHSFFALA